MYPPLFSLAKDQGQTKEEPKMNQRTLHYKKCVLLRLPFLFRLLYLALFHREKTERQPREDLQNTSTIKVHFLNIVFPKRLTHFLTKFTPLLNYLTLCTPCSFLSAKCISPCLLLPNHTLCLYS